MNIGYVLCALLAFVGLGCQATAHPNSEHQAAAAWPAPWEGITFFDAADQDAAQSKVAERGTLGTRGYRRVQYWERSGEIDFYGSFTDSFGRTGRFSSYNWRTAETKREGPPPYSVPQREELSRFFQTFADLLAEVGLDAQELSQLKARGFDGLESELASVIAQPTVSSANVGDVVLLRDGPFYMLTRVGQILTEATGVTFQAAELSPSGDQAVKLFVDKNAIVRIAAEVFFKRTVDALKLWVLTPAQAQKFLWGLVRAARDPALLHGQSRALFAITKTFDSLQAIRWLLDEFNVEVRPGFVAESKEETREELLLTLLSAFGVEVQPTLDTLTARSATPEERTAELLSVLIRTSNTQYEPALRILTSRFESVESDAFYRAATTVFRYHLTHLHTPLTDPQTPYQAHADLVATNTTSHLAEQVLDGSHYVRHNMLHGTINGKVLPGDLAFWQHIWTIDQALFHRLVEWLKQPNAAQSASPCVGQNDTTPLGFQEVTFDVLAFLRDTPNFNAAYQFIRGHHPGIN